jgi:hypothetical protein
MKTLLLAMTAALFASTALAADKDTRCYELRIYYAAPGRLDALNARFRDHTVKLFEKHGMQNLGYWMPQDNTNSRLIYLLAYPSREAGEKAFRAFGADPEWKKVQKASEANGQLVAKIDSVFLEATDYSPAIKSTTADPSRVFELRTYTTTPGNLGPLDSRFRDHTIKLFEKHGMQNIGYWHYMPKQRGAENTLIYLLAHKSKASAEESFKDFREDPDWIAVRKASEEKAGGSLTTTNGVKSLFMNPTDYSQMK